MNIQDAIREVVREISDGIGNGIHSQNIDIFDVLGILEDIANKLEGVESCK